MSQGAVAASLTAVLWLVCSTTVLSAEDSQAQPKVEAVPGRRLPGGVADFEPVVAVDEEGHVVVAAIGSTGIFIWNSTDGGKTFGMPQPAHPFAQQIEGDPRQADPALHSLGKGRFLLSLQSKRPKEGGTNCYFSRTEDGGKTWKLWSEVAAGKFDVDRPILAVSPNGRRAVLILNGGDINTTPVHFSNDGATTWTPSPKPVAQPKQSMNPYGSVIDDEGRAVISHAVFKGQAVHVMLAATEDGGKSWHRHDLGRVADKQFPSADASEAKANVSMWASGASLSRGSSGFVHALYASAAEKGAQHNIRYTRSNDGKEWSEPVTLSQSRAPVKAYPVIVASGERLHACWLEWEDGWCQVWYRGSLDGGNTWSDRVAVSKPEKATELMTENGFRRFSGHYFGVAEDGLGTAHVVWAAAGAHSKERGEVWHATVRLIKK